MSKIPHQPICMICIKFRKVEIYSSYIKDKIAHTRSQNQQSFVIIRVEKAEPPAVAVKNVGWTLLKNADLSLGKLLVLLQ